MRDTRLVRLLLVVVAVVAMAWMLRPDGSPSKSSPPESTAHTSNVPTSGAPAVDAKPTARTQLPDFLPAEAESVIRRIQLGGSFPHWQDGSVFGNRERRLPPHEHGYYREYTVPTPGLSHRGARRIVTGGRPPRDWYYTDDHYESFRPFQPPPVEARQ